METKTNYFREYFGAIAIPEYCDGTDICLICREQLIDLSELLYDEYTDEIFHINCFILHWEESACNFAWYNDGVVII